MCKWMYPYTFAHILIMMSIFAHPHTDIHTLYHIRRGEMRKGALEELDKALPCLPEAWCCLAYPLLAGHSMICTPRCFSQSSHGLILALVASKTLDQCWRILDFKTHISSASSFFTSHTAWHTILPFSFLHLPLTALLDFSPNTNH